MQQVCSMAALVNVALALLVALAARYEILTKRNA